MTSVRGALWLAALAVASVAACALLVVVPYFVNDLDRFPLADVAIGYHDPKDLWPTTIPYVGGWLHLGGVLSMLLAPTVLIAVAIASGFGVAFGFARKAWSAAAAFALVALACVLASAWFFSPFAQALATWQMD